MCHERVRILYFVHQTWGGAWIWIWQLTLPRHLQTPNHFKGLFGRKWVGVQSLSNFLEIHVRPFWTFWKEKKKTNKQTKSMFRDIFAENSTHVFLYFFWKSYSLKQLIPLSLLLALLPGHRTVGSWSQVSISVISSKVLNLY